MSNIRVPSFLTKVDKVEKIKLIKQWADIKGYECIWLLRDSLEDEPEKLIEEDERSSATWFQTKWGRAKRLGRREQLRKMIKDLT